MEPRHSRQLSSDVTYGQRPSHGDLRDKDGWPDRIYYVAFTRIFLKLPHQLTFLPFPVLQFTPFSTFSIRYCRPVNFYFTIVHHVYLRLKPFRSRPFGLGPIDIRVCNSSVSGDCEKRGARSNLVGEIFS